MAAERISIVLTAAAFAIVAAMGISGAEASDRKLIGIIWNVEWVKGAGDVDSAQATFKISKEGRVATTLGCDRTAGTATIDGNKISFGPLMSTRKACAPVLIKQEQIYADLLAEVRAFAFEDGLLKLKNGNGTVLLSFARGG